MQVALLDQVGFDHVLNGLALFANARRNVVQPNRAAVKAVNDCFEQFAVHQIEPLGVDIEHGQGSVGNIQRDLPRAFDISIVAHPAQQPVGNARRAARAPRNLKAARIIGGHMEQAGAAAHDARQLFGGVELQPRHDAKAVAQRVGQHAGAGGGTHQREGLQIKLDRARRRALANHDVDFVVFQRRVENLFHHGGQAVDFVDEQDIVFFQVGQKRSEVLGLFQHRAAGLPQLDAELMRNDVRQGGLAQAGRAKQQHMVQRLVALARRADENLQLLAHLGLAHVLVEQLGAQRALHRLFVGRGRVWPQHALGGGGKIVGLYAHVG